RDKSQKARMVGAQGVRNNLLLELRQHLAKVGAGLRGRLAEQTLHGGTGRRETDRLLGQGRVMTHEPVEGLGSPGAQPSRVGMTQGLRKTATQVREALIVHRGVERVPLPSAGAQSRSRACSWRKCSATRSGAMCQPQSSQVGALS